MTTVTVNSIASDVVGHYGNAAKNLVAVYRSACERAAAAGSDRYASLVERLPVVGEQGKSRMVLAEQRVAAALGERVARIADGYDQGIKLVSSQMLKGIEAFAERSGWTKDMFVVGALRRLNLPAAELSLEIARRIDEATSSLSARAEGAVAQPVATTQARRAVKPARRAVKRVRRAA
ncbi:MAG: hypothetical protein JO090_05055 [Rhizobacter sp.]|nr:hypothetical protein [Rhizobacter sp.]